MQNQQNSMCCPKFNPEKWDNKTFNWDNQLFIRESVPTLLHIPFPPLIGKKIVKMIKMAEESGVMLAEKEDMLILFHDPHAFKTELYLSVTALVSGADNVKISGTFMTKVFDGPYKDVPKFINLTNEYLTGLGKKAKRYYIHYAYCPKCSKKFGHHYMVLFAQV